MTQSFGGNVGLSTASVKRRDSGGIELALFRGEQGAVTPFALPDAFEMRFGGKLSTALPSLVPAVAAGDFVFHPGEQVYFGVPSFNTIQLDALFVQAAGYRLNAGDYTLVTADKNLLVAITGEDDSTVTVPANLLANTDVIFVENASTGTMTIAPASGVTLTPLTTALGEAALELSTGRVLKLTRVSAEAWNAEIAPEIANVDLACEFTWRSIVPLSGWSTTETFTLRIENDILRGDEGAPADASAPTIYATKAELQAYVRFDVPLTLTEDEKNRVCDSIGALREGQVVTVTDQDLEPELQEQARDNIGAASSDDLDALSAVVATKASQASLDALNAVVATKAAITTTNTLAARITAVEDQLGSGAGQRPPILFMPVGNGTAVTVVGARNAATGTATARHVRLYASTSTMTNGVSSTLFVHATGYTLANNDEVVLVTTGTLPAPFNSFTPYFVRDYNAVTRNFSLALTPGGSSIARTSAGSGTQTVAKTVVSVVRRARRIGYVSAATAGSSAGTRHDYMQWAVNTDPVLGSWRWHARFAISDAAVVANARMFVGLVNRSSALPNANPSALLNCIGVAADTGDSNLYLIHNDGVGVANNYPLGSGFPANTRNEDLYHLELSCDSTRAVQFKVTNLRTGQMDNGDITTDLPATHALLAAHCWRNNGTTAAAVGLDVAWWKMDQDV